MRKVYNKKHGFWNSCLHFVVNAVLTLTFCSMGFGTHLHKVSHGLKTIFMSFFFPLIAGDVQ